MGEEIMSMSWSKPNAWLLLLPAPPLEISLVTFKAAYKPALTVALRDASQQTKRSGHQTELHIGLRYEPASILRFSRVQAFLALFYELICITCTELHIDVQYDNDVDARAFLFEDIEPCQKDNESPKDSMYELQVLPTFHSIAKSNLTWSQICFVHGDIGESMLERFVDIRKNSYASAQISGHIVRLPGGLSVVNADNERVPQDETEEFPQYNSVAVGGTFDHLHAGHKLLLTITAIICRRICTQDSQMKPCMIIGITGDELLKSKKYREHLQDWDQRQSSVRRFINGYLQLLLKDDKPLIKSTDATPSSIGRRLVVDTLQSGLQIRYVEIVDPYGPTVEDVNITALVISAETRSGGDSVNAKRKEKDWPALDVFEVHVLGFAESSDGETNDKGDVGFANKMSSTEIRSRIHSKLSQPTSDP